MRVILIGATGLVGGDVARGMLERGHDVHAIVRRATYCHHPRWHEHIGEIDAWPAIVATLGGDAFVSALGTTIRKAGSRAAFASVDRDALVAVAKAARGAGVNQAVLVSAVGADPGARNFYLRTKGEAEAAVAAMGFACLDILQPGLLTGARAGDRRILERLGILASPLTDRLLAGDRDHYASIPATTVAEAILACLARSESRLTRHRNRDIKALAAR